MSNLEGMFTDVNEKVDAISGEVSLTPATWNSSIFSMIENLSDTVIIPMQDVLGLDGSCRMNYPGTIGGNWVWRMKPDQLSLELSMKYYRLNKETERQ